MATEQTELRGTKAEDKIPQRSMASGFFGNAFVQAVLVFVALAVAFSGKLDHHGTVVAILIAWIIGAIGIYTHLSRTTTKKVVSAVLITLWGLSLWAFDRYLTPKTQSIPIAAVTTAQRQEASIVAPVLSTKPEIEKRKSPEKTSKPNVQKNDGGANNTNTQIGTARGPIAVAPGGIAIAGGIVTNPTVNNNNFGPPPPNITYRTDDLSTESESIIKVTLRTDRDISLPTFSLLFDDPIENADVTLSYANQMQLAGKYLAKNNLQIGFAFTVQWPVTFPAGAEIYVTARGKQPLKLTGIKQGAP